MRYLCRMHVLRHNIVSPTTDQRMAGLLRLDSMLSHAAELRGIIATASTAVITAAATSTIVRP